jgi:hypothetical protein
VTPSPRIPLPVGPQIPKGQRFGVKPKTAAGAKEIVIAPKVRTAKYPFEFLLEKRTSGLALVFRSSDPQMVLNPKGTFAIQLNVDEPVEVTPDVVTGRDWEKAGGKELPVQVTGKPEGEEPAFITGEASFTVCHAVTKQCQKKRNLFRQPL